jgi:hypothetical protein
VARNATLRTLSRRLDLISFLEASRSALRIICFTTSPPRLCATNAIVLRPRRFSLARRARIFSAASGRCIAEPPQRVAGAVYPILHTATPVGRLQATSARRQLLSRKTTKPSPCRPGARGRRPRVCTWPMFSEGTSRSARVSSGYWRLESSWIVSRSPAHDSGPSLGRARETPTLSPTNLWNSNELRPRY